MGVILCFNYYAINVEKKIEFDERTTQVILKEGFYKCNTDFFEDHTCLEDSVTLCKNCSRYLCEILNFHTDRFDF